MRDHVPLARPMLALAGALIGWLGLALQLYLTIELKRTAGEGIGAALWLYVGFFTILTNLLVAIALTAAARRSDGGFWRRPGVHTSIAMSIIVVGLIYNIMLRGLWHPRGLTLFADVIVHDVMPAWFLVHWWLAIPKQGLYLRDVWRWLLYPAAYFVYVLLRGAWDGWYPYPFLDVKNIGYAQVAIDAAVVLALFLALGLILLALARWQSRRTT